MPNDGTVKTVRTFTVQGQVIRIGNNVFSKDGLTHGNVLNYDGILRTIGQTNGPVVNTKINAKVFKVADIYGLSFHLLINTVIGN